MENYSNPLNIDRELQDAFQRFHDAFQRFIVIDEGSNDPRDRLLEQLRNITETLDELNNREEMLRIQRQNIQELHEIEPSPRIEVVLEEPEQDIEEDQVENDEMFRINEEIHSVGRALLMFREKIPVNEFPTIEFGPTHEYNGKGTIELRVHTLSIEQKKRLLVIIGRMARANNFVGMQVLIRVEENQGLTRSYKPVNVIEEYMVDTSERFDGLYTQQTANGNYMIRPLEKIVKIFIEINTLVIAERVTHHGNFFPYTINLKCNELEHLLEPFEIFTQKKWKPTENCFYRALVNWNKYCENTEGMTEYSIDPVVIQKIKYRLKGTGITKTLIENIAKDYNLYFKIRVFVLKGSDELTTRTSIESCYGTKTQYPIELGLIMINAEGHYFPNYKIPITEAGINNYFLLKIHFRDIPLNQRLMVKTVRKQNRMSGGQCFQVNVPDWNVDSSKFLKAHVAIEMMLKYHDGKNMFFDPIPNAIMYRGLASKTNTVIKNIQIDLSEARKITRDEEPINNDVVYVADTECATQDRHIPYAIAFCKLGDDEHTRTFLGERCIDEFIDEMNVVSNDLITRISGDGKNKRAPKIVVYFHNLSYDGRMFVDHKIYSVKMNSNKIIQMKVMIPNGLSIILRDSLMLINTKLANFPKMFNTVEKSKKIFPYSFITMDMFTGPCVRNLNEIVATQKWSETEIETFKEILIEDKILNENGDVNIHQMIISYVQSDVKILSQGLSKFSKDLQEALGLNLFNYLSISSVAFDYIKKNAFDGENIYEYTGELRDFIRQAAYGGRCMTRGNCAYRLIGRFIDDIDACSLYPSAMSIMKIPKGVPKKFESLTYENRRNNIFDENDKQYIEKCIKNEKINGAILRIKITDIGRTLKFPLVCKKDYSGVIQYENYVGGEMIIDDVYFMDLLKWQQISYELLEMIYWDEGYSTKINDCIKTIYNKRAEAKIRGETIEQVYKLIMNSSYGKCIEKPHDTKIIVVQGKYFTKHLSTHYVNVTSYDQVMTFRDHWEKERILESMDNIDSESSEYNILQKSLETIENRSQYLFHENVQYDDFYVPVMVGVRVLSMSKYLMNQVMVPAEIHNVVIYYQDTDSMHVEASQIKLLEEAWEKENDVKHAQRLLGNGLCQFHSDFDKVNGKDAVSIGSIFLAKKMYMDCLSARDEIEDVDAETVMMTRMKGVPKISLLTKRLPSGKTGNDLVLEIYNGLFDGYSYNFDLVAEKTRIQFMKNLEVKTIYSFIRTANSPKCPRIDYLGEFDDDGNERENSWEMKEKVDIKKEII